MVNNDRGIALLMTLFFIVFMSFLATSVSYETIVGYNVSSQKVNRLKAYYAAKSGIEISLLRVLIYKKVLAQFPEFSKSKSSILEPLWKFPFAWPPSRFLGEEANITAAALDQIKSAEKKSRMEAQYLTTIESEDGKININALSIGIKNIEDIIISQLLSIFHSKLEADEDFREKYEDVNFQELINNIADWVDEDSSSRNGGNESAVYLELLSKATNFNKNYIPPNHEFKTLDELRMVFGMKDDFFNLLKDKITVYGSFSININQASRDLLVSLDKAITKEVADKIIERREDSALGGAFKNLEDFESFVTGLGINFVYAEGKGFPLSFSAPYNFKITSVGEHLGSQKEILVITYDVQNAVKQLTSYLVAEDQREFTGESSERSSEQDSSNSDRLGRSGGKNLRTQKKEKIKIPKDRPHVVYWEEN